MPGWRDGLTGGGIQHLVVDTEIVWGAAARVARAGRPRRGRRPDRRPHHQHHARASSGAGRRCGSTRPTGTCACTRRPRRSAATRRTCTASSSSSCGASWTARSKPMEGARSRTSARPTASTTSRAASENHKYNLDSAEYANIVCGMLVAYQQARDAGMPALDSTRAAVIRNWCERVLCGYWTHAGYLNWDTGLGFKRWHQGKKLGLSQAALLGIALLRRARRPRRRGPSTCSTAPSSCSAAGPSAPAASRRRTRSACRRSTATSPRRCSPPRACRPTPPRPRCSGSARRPRRSRRRCTPTTPTSAGWP